MRRRTRRGLFYFSLLIFLILSWLVVFYALGYKYDFVQNRFFKTGSFEVRTNINAQIYINDEFAGATSFLGSSFSKSRLLPRTYAVRVQNEKYQSWQKLVDVEPGVFVNFPRVVLIPQNLAEEVIASSSLSSIASIKFDPKQRTVSVSNKRQTETISLDNGRRILLLSLIKPAPSPTANSEINLIKSPDGDKGVWLDSREGWVKWLKDTGYQPTRKAGETELVTRFSQKISDVQWYKDSDHLIVDAGGVLKFIEIDNRGGINISDVSTIDGPFYYDKGSDVIFKFAGNKLVKIPLR